MINNILFVNFSGTDAITDCNQNVNSITVRCNENIDGDYYVDNNVLYINCKDEYEYNPKKFLVTIKSILDIKEYSDITNIYVYKKFLSNLSIQKILESSIIKGNDYTGYAVKITADRSSHKKFVSNSSRWKNKSFMGSIKPHCDIEYGFSLSRKSMEILSREYKASDLNLIYDEYINQDILIGNTLNKHRINAIDNQINIFPINQKINKSTSNKVKTISFKNNKNPNNTNKNVLGIDKIFYINLEHRTDRRKYMESHLKRIGIPFERIEASQVKNINQLFDYKSKFYSLYQRLSSGAMNFLRDPNCHKRIKSIIGCYHSHISLYEKISKLDGERYLILEDDCGDISSALIKIKNDFDSNIIKDDWDLVRSVWSVNNPKKTKLFDGVHRLSNHRRDNSTHNFCGGTHFTLVNQKSAKKVYEYLNSEDVFDLDAVLSTNQLNVYYNYYNIPYSNFTTDIPKVKSKLNHDIKNKLLFVRISCKKESSQWTSCLETHEDQIIVCADPDLESNYRFDDHILTVKCNDDYESLPEKVVATYNAIIDCEQLKEYTHIIKIDNDVDINKILKYTDDNKIFINNYTGGIVHTLAARNWHFDKVSSDCYWYKKMYDGPVVPYAGGGKTYTLSRKAMKCISKTYNFDNLHEIKQKYILEDVMIGVILHKHNIKPIKNDVSKISHTLNIGQHKKIDLVFQP